jgi:hypothetical protein
MANSYINLLRRTPGRPQAEGLRSILFLRAYQNLELKWTSYVDLRPNLADVQAYSTLYTMIRSRVIDVLWMRKWREAACRSDVVITNKLRLNAFYVDFFGLRGSILRHSRDMRLKPRKQYHSDAIRVL